jgi:hypothetical protein
MTGRHPVTRRPGVFQYKYTASGISYQVKVPRSHYYGIHVEVKQCKPIRYEYYEN